MVKPLHDVAIALVLRGDRWLVAKRHPAAHLGGLWEFPGGKRIGDETPEQTALRELHEECAVQATPSRVLDPLTREHEDRIVRITPVLCRWDAGEPRALGNEACRWVTAQELLSLAMPPVNREIIRAALDTSKSVM